MEITVYTPRCQSLRVDGKEYDVGWSLPGSSAAVALAVTIPKAGPAYRLKAGDREVVITLADGEYVHIYDEGDGFLIGQSNKARRYYPVSP